MPCWSGFWDLLGASRFVASTLLDAPHDNPTSRKILRTPKDYGMDFQSVTFPALDGSKVSAWYIPAKDPSSKKLAIVGHQSWSYANKSGMQTLRMFVVLKQIGIDYVKLHKVLYDAGFHVVAYDMRNHGESEARKPSGYGEVEYQDAAGVMDWVNAHPVLGDCRVCLLPFCVSGIAFLKANALYPEKFRNVVAWATTNVFDLRTAMIKNPYGMGMLDEKLVSKALQEKHESYLKTGACQPNPHITFAMEHISGKTWARALKVPVLFCDPRDDWLFNHINDAPPIFAEFGADLPEDKKRRNEFHWIGTRQPGPFKTKTDNRCEGYNYYQSESGSKVMLEFFGKWCP